MKKINVKTFLAVLLIALVIPGGCAKSPKAVIEKAQKLEQESKYEGAITLLEQASAGSKDSLEYGKALAEAHLAYGNYILYKSELHPVEKYKRSLVEYRRVLLYDPENREARRNKDSVEDIYIKSGIPFHR